jgi:4-diphosphocytidyl-2-C-methyl-D-erythritol kinase
MATTTIKAYAKVNLTLEVLDRRDDGFHDIATVLQTIDLWDELSFEDETDIELESDSGVPPEEDLIVQAAGLLKWGIGEERGARITVKKHVPIAAGLGGGSSDAAATLMGLGRLWGHAITYRDLRPLCEALGSDVSFFLFGGTALGEGRGETITPLPAVPEQWLVLATPEIDLEGKTAKLYAALQPSDFSFGVATKALTLALRSGERLTSSHLFNAFDSVADKVYPDFPELRQGLLREGASSVHLSGSGPTLFSLVSDQEEGTALARRWAGLGVRTHVVKTVANTYNRP